MPKNTSKKKIKDTTKPELLNSLIENNEMEEPGLEEIANGITDPADTTRITKHYKEMFKIQNKNVINIAGKRINY